MSSRGYFGIGVEGISKEQNVGTIARSAHAFGASFFFTIEPNVNMRKLRVSDTSSAFEHMPYYQYDSVGEVDLPHKCSLVAVELTPDAVELPSFKHPVQAAYVLGPEMGSVSPALLEKCDFTIKIPMQFCVNVGVAGAIVMYDRLISMGRFAPRPVKAGGPDEPLAVHNASHRRFSRARQRKDTKQQS